MGTQEIIGQAIGIIAMVVMSLSYQCKKSTHVFLVQLIACLLFFVISPCWIIYNVVVFSIAGILNETLNIGSILISLIRYKGFREE